MKVSARAGEWAPKSVVSDAGVSASITDVCLCVCGNHDQLLESGQGCKCPCTGMPATGASGSPDVSGQRGHSFLDLKGHYRICIQSASYQKNWHKLTGYQLLESDHRCGCLWPMDLATGETGILASATGVGVVACS